MVDQLKKILCFILLATLLVLPSSAFAHRLDEYLQAMLVTIESGRIRLEINLTPGTNVANQVLALIDRDGDGIFSAKEGAAYCELLKRDLIVRLDGREVKLKLEAFNFQPVSELRTGWGIIQVEFSISPGRLAAGAHKLTIENRHLPRISVYLLNAARPDSDAIQVVKQIRNENQSTGEIDFEYHGLVKPVTSSGTIFVIVTLFAAAAGAALWRKPANPKMVQLTDAQSPSGPNT